MSGHAHFDFARLSERERYKLLIGTVIPRPIAWVTTQGPDGRGNAGPFSFFNVLTHDPAIVAIGVENYADGRPKDTIRNIRATGEFTVHICNDALVDAMELTAIKFGPDIDELALAGLATVPGTMVDVPRIVAAPAALECQLKTTMSFGPAREIIFGEVLGLFIRDDLVDRQTLHIDQVGMDAIGRLGGHLYARTRDQFEKKTLTLSEWEARQAATATATRSATA